MDIFEKSLEIWKEIKSRSSQVFEQSIIIDNEYIGKGSNCISSSVHSIIILDGDLNQLHFLRNKDENLEHITVYMTPQPIHKYSHIHLSVTKQFVALVGDDTVGIVDITKLSHNKTCKKVKEILKSEDKIVSVQWYPNINDCLVVLTKQSIEILKYQQDLKAIPCFQYYLIEEVGSHSKSFGIKDEFVTFDFGSSDMSSDDNKLFILTDSGNVLLLPELRTLIKETHTIPKKLKFCPSSPDNYQDDFTSLTVLRGSLDVIVIVNCHGSAQHALVIDNNVCVYETINVVSIETNKESESSGPIVIADRHSNPPRYMLLHTGGVHSCVLPWVVHLRLAVRSDSSDKLTSVINKAGHAIIDHVVHSRLRQDSAPTMVAGVSIVRSDLREPELFVFMDSGVQKERRMACVRLRQESSFLLAEEEDLGVLGVRVGGTADGDLPDNVLLRAVMAELARGGRLPLVSASVPGGDGGGGGEEKLALVLKISEQVSSGQGVRLAAAGKILESRAAQMGVAANLQLEQAKEVALATAACQKTGQRLLGACQVASSRQQRLLDRLNRCSNRLTAILNTIPRADREAAATIRDVEQRLASMGALLRGCTVRFQQNVVAIDAAVTRRVAIAGGDVGQREQAVLKREDEDIRRLVDDLKGLFG